MSESDNPTPVLHEGGRFREWSTVSLAQQCLAQAREQLDPEFSQFMTAVAERLATPQPAEARGMVEEIEPILVRRCLQNRMEGYTLETAKEIAAALSATLSPHAGGGEAPAASPQCPVCYDDKPHTHNAVEAVEMRGLEFPATNEAWTRYSGRILDAGLINELDFLFKKARRASASPPAPADKAGLVEAPEYEVLAEGYKAISGKAFHASDCATSCTPAYKPGPCDCDAPEASAATEYNDRLWNQNIYLNGKLREALDIAQSLREELVSALEDLIDHNGDDMNDSRSKRVSALRANGAEREGWQDIASVAPPATGGFMLWSPDHPEWPMPVKAEIYHGAMERERAGGQPSHLRFGHFTHWRHFPVLPIPPEGERA